MQDQIFKLSQILLNEEDHFIALEHALNYIRETLDADIVTLLEIYKVPNDENRKVRALTRVVKNTSDFSSKTHLNAILQSQSFNDIFKTQDEQMSSDEIVFLELDKVDTLPTELNLLVKNEGINQIAMLPVSFNHTLWGSILICFSESKQMTMDQEHFLLCTRNFFNLYMKNNYQLNKVTEGLANDHGKKMATLGVMAAGIAHEINNPLFVISAFAAKIDNLMARKELDLGQLERVSHMIQKNCKRIAGIVQGMHMYSRDTCRDEFEVECVKNIVENSLELSKERMRLHEIDLRLSFDEDELPVECKASQLAQVLVNLLNNSYDSIVNNKGDKWVEIGAHRDGDRVQITVTDSGEKLSDELKKKILQPFFTTKKKGQGTGLGLSISREIVHSHDGVLSIDDSSKNASFIIDLPILLFE